MCQLFFFFVVGFGNEIRQCFGLVARWHLEANAEGDVRHCQLHACMLRSLGCQLPACSVPTVFSVPAVLSLGFHEGRYGIYRLKLWYVLGTK